MIKLARIKIIKIAGKTQLVTMDKFEELVESKTPFKDMGTKEI